MRREGESRREDEKEKVEDAVGSRHWVKEQVSIKEIFGVNAATKIPHALTATKQLQLRSDAARKKERAIHLN